MEGRKLVHTMQTTDASGAASQKMLSQLDVLTDKVEGGLLQNRYKVGRLIDKGSFGLVYKVTDTQARSKQPLVVKMSEKTKIFCKEISAIKNIWKTSQAAQADQSNLGKTPEVKAYGTLVVTDSNQSSADPQEYKLMSYLVMPRYGINLESLFQCRNNQFSKESTYFLGIQLLNMLQQVHEAGYVYNDLKLDNLLLNYGTNSQSLIDSQSNIFKENSVNLIDFGFATRYLDKKTKLHLEKKEVNTFRGNMVFASLNQLKFHSTSRRDDLISLFYLLVFMVRGGSMPGFEIDNRVDKNQQFRTIKAVKESQRLRDVCFDNTSELSAFMREVFSYRFKDTPRYDYLRSLLQGLIEE